MKLRSLEKLILAGLFVAVSGKAAAQIPLPPVPPLPSLEVHIATSAPPAVRYEHRGPRPGEEYVWVKGFWTWDSSRWHWVPGRWEPRAEPNAYWIAPRYIHSGHGYIYEPGHWSTQTIVVNDDVRRRSEWRHHEHDQEREMQHDSDHRPPG